MAGVLTASVRRTADVDDLVQDVVLAAWQAARAGRYRPDPAVPPGYSLRRWLAGIAWRIASHHRQRAQVRREIPHGSALDLLAELADPTPNALDLLADQEQAGHLADRLTEALFSLPPSCRRLMVALADGMTVSAYARAEGLLVSTAFTQLHVARDRLRPRLADLASTGRSSR